MSDKLAAVDWALFLAFLAAHNGAATVSTHGRSAVMGRSLRRMVDLSGWRLSTQEEEPCLPLPSGYELSSNSHSDAHQINR